MEKVKTLILKNSGSLLRVALICVIVIAALPVQGQNYIIRNVNVIPMTGEQQVIKQRDVYVEDGRITAISSSSSDKPDGFDIIEANGNYLMPGLAEMHAHIPPISQGREYIEEVLFLYLSNGITTIRAKTAVSYEVKAAFFTTRPGSFGVVFDH